MFGKNLEIWKTLILKRDIRQIRKTSTFPENVKIRKKVNLRQRRDIRKSRRDINIIEKRYKSGRTLIFKKEGTFEK